MGKYGEPWRQKGEACIVNCDGNEIYCGEPYVAYGFATATLEKHAVACVNALAGRDPAALDGLVDAVKALMGYDGESAIGSDIGDRDDVLAAWGDLEAALAVFQGGGE